MAIPDLDIIVQQFQDIAAEAKVKRDNFKAPDKVNFREQAMGESVAVGKCLNVLVDLYPDEMAALTEVVE